MAEVGCKPRQPRRAHALTAAFSLPESASRRHLPGADTVVEGRGGWREEEEGGSQEDFPKEASPGQMGEEGSAWRQEGSGTGCLS